MGSTYMEAKEEITLGGIKIRPGDMFNTFFNALHHDRSQWQRPMEFLPERWEEGNPLSLTPSGQKRERFSFCPFSGGRRICFGKTFAEVNMKLLVTYFSQAFDFELVDPRYKTEYPLAHIGISGVNKIEVVFTKRK